MTEDVEMKEQPAAAPSNSVSSAAPSTLQREEPIKLCILQLGLRM